VGISNASPGWQEYMNYANEIVLNSFKASTQTSLKNMLNEMTVKEAMSLKQHIVKLHNFFIFI
jgi:serine protease inhibitor